MRRKLPIAVLFLVAAAAAAWWLWPCESAVPVAEPPLKGDRATLVKSLLTDAAKGDGAHESLFFRTLKHLLRKEKLLNEGLYWMYCSDGRAVRVTAGDETYVVAIVHGVTPVIPGDDYHVLILFNTEGQVMDTLNWSISNRITTVYIDGGRTETAVDGATFICRYIRGRVSGCRATGQPMCRIAMRSIGFIGQVSRPKSGNRKDFAGSPCETERFACCFRTSTRSHRMSHLLVTMRRP